MPGRPRPIPWRATPIRPTLFIAVIAALLALAAPAQASRNQIVTFEAPRDLLNADTRESALAELDSLGVKALRVVMYWRNVAPEPASRVKPSFDETDPGAYAWGQYDALLDAAEARGWYVLLTVTGPVPRWATNGARNTTYRPSPNSFRKFMTAVGLRFGDRVDAISVWNEPNHPRFLTPQFTKRKRPASPGIYRKLYAAALRGLSGAGLGELPVLMGETAPRGTGKVVAPVDFVRGALCLNSRWRKRSGCGRLRVDGWAHHPYTTRRGPFFVPRSKRDVTIGSMSRLTRALDRAARAGTIPRRLPVHITEFGIQSEPDPLYGVSFTRQEEYRAISERIAWNNPRIKSFSQYLLRDDNPIRGVPRIARYGGFESGLRTSSGRAKKALDGFRLPLVATRGRRGVSLWGHVRPATGGQAVTVEYSSDGGRRWRKLATVSTDARGAWKKGTRYRKGRRYRVRWTSPEGVEYAGSAIRAYRRR